MNWKHIWVIILLIITQKTLPIVIRISRTQAKQIGNQIWKNECGGRIEGLTHWVPGEACASLGIGHFIWYPKNAQDTQYTQTFPSLITYLKKNGVKIPTWLDKNKESCPWNSYDNFLAAQTSKPMLELRSLLANHIDLQARFIIERLIQALPNMLSHVAKNKIPHIKQQFYRVAKSPNGLYALIDYVNFKGEGINIQERYNGYGWGLLQVLEHMRGVAVGPSATHEFAQAAAHVLTQRIKNAPAHNTIDKKFLHGWLNRVETYKKLNLL